VQAALAMCVSYMRVIPTGATGCAEQTIGR
jgi:hypothetical protein